MALSGTLGSLGLDDVVGFLSTHGVEGVLTICGATASLRLLVLPGRLLIPEARPGRLSADALDALLSRADRVGRSRARRMSRGQIDELMARARATRTRPSRARAAGRTGRVERADLEAIHARAEQTRASRRVSGRVERTTIDDMLDRADALGESDVASRRHRVASQVHAVSASGGASFAFAPCALSDDLVRDIEALGGLAIDPLALLMEVARLDDEHQRKPSQARTRAVRRHAPAIDHNEPTAALQGDIDGVGLAALLQTLRERRRGGTLVLRAGGREERLYFVQGEAFALRVDADDEFAFTLLGADAADSVRALVRGAAVEERALTAADQQRLRERFLDVLFAEGATFAFLQDDLPPDVHAPRRGITRIALQTERFLLEAIQRMVEWDTLRESISDGRAVLRFASAEAKLAAIRDRGCSEVLTLVDGRLSFDDVVGAARAPRVETARVVAALIGEGLLLATSSGT